MRYIQTDTPMHTYRQTDSNSYTHHVMMVFRCSTFLWITRAHVSRPHPRLPALHPPLHRLQHRHQLQSPAAPATTPPLILHLLPHQPQSPAATTLPLILHLLPHPPPPPPLRLNPALTIQPQSLLPHHSPHPHQSPHPATTRLLSLLPPLPPHQNQAQTHPLPPQPPRLNPATTPQP